ncbi:MAG: GNAT family N-acetyltransferase [Magnetospiraceae bacterium]
MIEYRTGEATDSRAIASLMCQAGGGLMEYLLEGVLPNCSPLDVLELAITDEDSPLNHENAVLGVAEDQIIALLLSYPTQKFGLDDIMQENVPADRLDHLKALFGTPMPKGLYVNSVAVDAAFGGHGIGGTLMTIADTLALAQGFDTICLHVWADNPGAIHMYETAGFQISADIPVVRHPLLPHDGGKYLMVKKITE